tara:strand:+ start:2839 stop:3381 length:543 start_codon:yes stop_codon:yes gene_type:complete
MRISVFFLIPSIAVGFIPTTKPVVRNFNYQGDVPPVGYFDPGIFSSNASDDTIKYLREAELQHGRVAMMSFVALAGLDLFRDDLAIDALAKLSFEEQTPYWLGVALYEFARMGAGWRNPFVESSAYFKLEDNYQPGNVLKMNAADIPDRKYNVELSNGRLAMLACLGYMAEEFVTRVPIF